MRVAVWLHYADAAMSVLVLFTEVEFQRVAHYDFVAAGRSRVERRGGIVETISDKEVLEFGGMRRRTGA